MGKDRELFEQLLGSVFIPRFAPVLMNYEQPQLPCIEAALWKQLENYPGLGKIGRSDTVAIAVGSREIDGLAQIVRTLAEFLKAKGAKPFIVPSMGSHGGATALGQETVLRHLGITEESTGAPIRSSMSTETIGETPGGLDVRIDSLAYHADHIIPIARIKAHTEFRGAFESGILKMLVIGLGKQHGASICHRLDFPNMSGSLMEFGTVILNKAPVLAGIGIVENAGHRVAHIEVVPKDRILEREPELLRYSKSLLPRIPFDQLDVLLVQEMGKEISGAGMDTNITGRSCMLGESWPHAERIVVWDLTEKSEGNAAGMGNADVITKRLYNKINFTPIYVNGITCHDTQGIRMPVVMETDELALRMCLYTCIRRNAVRDGRVVMIKNTADLQKIYISEALLEEAKHIEHLSILGDVRPMKFLNGMFQGFEGR